MSSFFHIGQILVHRNRREYVGTHIRTRSNNVSHSEQATDLCNSTFLHKIMFIASLSASPIVSLILSRLLFSKKDNAGVDIASNESPLD